MSERIERPNRPIHFRLKFIAPGMASGMELVDPPDDPKEREHIMAYVKQTVDDFFRGNTDGGS